GHALTEMSLVVEQARAVEGHLWAATRALEEAAELDQLIAERSGEGNDVAERLTTRAASKRRSADIVRSIALELGIAPGAERPREKPEPPAVERSRRVQKSLPGRRLRRPA